MIKKAHWGSQPLSGGRDWGVSKCMRDTTISRMCKFLEDADAVYGSGDFSSHPSTRYSTGSTEPSKGRGVFACTLVRRNTLTFEDEEDEGEDGGERVANSLTEESRPDNHGKCASPGESESSTEEEDDVFDGDGFDDEPLPVLGGLGGGGVNGRFSRKASIRRRSSSMFGRRESVGATAMNGLTLGSMGGRDENGEVLLRPLGVVDEQVNDGKVADETKRRKTMAKHRRMSMCANALDQACHRLSTVEVGKARESFSISSRLGRLSSLGTGLIAGKLSSIGGGLSRLTSKFGYSARVLVESGESEEVEGVGLDAQKEKTQDCARVDVAKALKENLPVVLSYLSLSELMTSTCLVNNEWWNVSVSCQASLVLVSVGCQDQVYNPVAFKSSAQGDSDSDSDLDSDSDEEDDDGEEGERETEEEGSVQASMKKPWKFLNNMYPFASFLSEGAFKKVYRVYNSTVGMMEALSVMDLAAIDDNGNRQVVGAELAVGVLLSGLVRRNICPNYITMRKVFTCEYPPPKSHWGDDLNKCKSSRGPCTYPRCFCLLSVVGD